MRLRESTKATEVVHLADQWSDEDVERLAKEAGLGDRTAKKLVNANRARRGEGPAEKPQRSRGHGAAREERTAVASF